MLSDYIIFDPSLILLLTTPSHRGQISQVRECENNQAKYGSKISITHFVCSSFSLEMYEGKRRTGGLRYVRYVQTCLTVIWLKMRSRGCINTCT